MQVGGPPSGSRALPDSRPLSSSQNTPLDTPGRTSALTIMTSPAGAILPAADPAMKNVAQELLQAAALLRPPTDHPVFGPRPGFATHKAPECNAAAGVYVDLLASLPEEIVMFFSLAMWQQSRAGKAYEAWMNQWAGANAGKLAIEMNAGAYRAALATASDLNKDAIESWQRVLQRAREVRRIFAGEVQTEQNAMLFSANQLANLKKLDAHFKQLAEEHGFDPL